MSSSSTSSKDHGESDCNFYRSPDASSLIKSRKDDDDSKLLYTDKGVLFFAGWPAQWFPSPFFDPELFPLPSIFSSSSSASPPSPLSFHNCEQYMMYRKALFFNDSSIAQQIIITKDPKQCKTLGRQVKGFSDEKWNTVCESIVYRGNLLKFQQNPSLKQRLLNTGKRWLAEASPYDGKWGIKLSIKDRDATDPKKWKGQNLLGKALEKVRDTIEKEEKEKIEKEKNNNNNNEMKQNESL